MANGRRNRSIYDSMYAPSPLEDLLASIPDKLIEMDRNRLQKKKYQDALTQQKFNNDRLMENDKFTREKYEKNQEDKEFNRIFNALTDPKQKAMFLRRNKKNDEALMFEKEAAGNDEIGNKWSSAKNQIQRTNNTWEKDAILSSFSKKYSDNPYYKSVSLEYESYLKDNMKDINNFGDGSTEPSNWEGPNSEKDKEAYSSLLSLQKEVYNQISKIKTDLIPMEGNPSYSKFYNEKVKSIEALENQRKLISTDKVNLSKKYRRENKEEYNIRKADERNTPLSTSIARPGTFEYEQAVAAMTSEDQEKALVSRKINEDNIASLYNFNEEINENNVAKIENNVNKDLDLILSDKVEGEEVVANDPAANLLRKVGVNTLQAGSPSQVVVDTSETKPVIEEVEIPQDGVSDESVGEQIGVTDQNVYNPPGIKRNEVPRKYKNATESAGKSLAKSFKRIKKQQDIVNYNRTINSSYGNKRLNSLKDSFRKDTTGIYDADAKRFKYVMNEEYSDSNSFEDSLLRYPELNGFTNRAEVQEFLDFMSQLNNSV